MFTPDQLNELRSRFAALDRLDPCSPTYQQFAKFLDNLPLPLLQQLAGADIKFLSALAYNRVHRDLISAAAEAIELFTEDELEAYANRNRKN